MILVVIGEVTKELSNIFFLDSVQELLFKLTHVDIQRTYRNRFIGQDPDTPIYKFMTTAEVEQVRLFTYIFCIYVIDVCKIFVL